MSTPKPKPDPQGSVYQFTRQELERAAYSIASAASVGRQANVLDLLLLHAQEVKGEPQEPEIEETIACGADPQGSPAAGPQRPPLCTKKPIPGPADIPCGLLDGHAGHCMPMRPNKFASGILEPHKDLASGSEGQGTGSGADAGNSNWGAEGAASPETRTQTYGDLIANPPLALKAAAMEIVQTLRPADPGSWDGNLPYLIVKLYNFAKPAPPSLTEQVTPAGEPTPEMREKAWEMLKGYQFQCGHMSNPGYYYVEFAAAFASREVQRLQPWIRHKSTCESYEMRVFGDIHTKTPKPCTCGLAAAIERKGGSQ